MLGSILSNPPPPNFLSNPFVPFFSEIGGIISALYGLGTIAYFVFKNRQQGRLKEIAYKIVSNTPIVSLNKALKGRIEIRVDGNLVTDDRLMVLEVWNSGKTSIKREDYFDPLKFEIETGKIISADILETRPVNLLDAETLKSFLKIEKNFIEFPLYQFNKNDLIRFSVLLSGTEEFQTRGRLDQGHIVNYNEYLEKQRTLRIRQLFISIGIFCVCVSLVFLAYSQSILIFLMFSIAAFANFMFWLLRLLGSQT